MTQNPPDKDIPVKRLRHSSSGGGLVPAEARSPFLKGPIPLPWLTRAATLSGKAINVGLALWWLAGMARDKAAPLKLNRAALKHLNVSDDAASDGLRRLEEAGLIAVERRRGQRPVVTLLRAS